MPLGERQQKMGKLIGNFLSSLIKGLFITMVMIMGLGVVIAPLGVYHFCFQNWAFVMLPVWIIVQIGWIALCAMLVDWLDGEGYLDLIDQVLDRQ